MIGAVPNRISYLDGVRGIAVLLVFLSHTSGRGFSLHPLLSLNGMGHIGVYLFFVLSAFFLGNGLFREGVTTQSTKKFYIKRLLRILPLYYLLLVIIIILQKYLGTDFRFLHIKDGIYGFVLHLLMYRGDGVFWSVVIEMQFYLIVPLVILLLIKYREKALLVLWLLALVHFVLYLCKFLHWPIASNAIGYITPNALKNGMYLDVFMRGITASYLVQYYWEYIEKYKKQIAWTSVALFFSLLIITFICVSDNFLGFHQPFYKLRYFSIIYSIVFSLFTLSVYAGNGINRFLDNPFMKYMGIWGFSVYLLHMAVFKLAAMVGLSYFVGFWSVLAGVMLISFITYTLIEKKSIDFSYYLIKRLKIETKNDKNKR